VHPFASAIDTELPKAPSSVHLLLRDKASWVEPQIGPYDQCFDGYPELSTEDWHKKHGLWIRVTQRPRDVPNTRQVIIDREVRTQSRSAAFSS
jgi:hypothetical protein